MRSYLVLVFGWLYAATYCSIFIIFTILTLGIFTPFVFHIACRGWGKGLFKIAKIELEIKNEKYLKDQCARVIIFNHQSLLDVIWLAATFVKNGVAVIKKEFIYIPFLNLSFYLAGFIFIDRSNRDKSIEAINRIGQKLKKRKLSLYMAPEGTRSKDGKLQPFKKGPFHLAISNKLPIYPIVIKGAHQLMPKFAMCPKPGKLELICLEPIDTTNWKLEDLDIHIQEVRDRFKEIVE